MIGSIRPIKSINAGNSSHFDDQKGTKSMSSGIISIYITDIQSKNFNMDWLIDQPW